MIFPSFSAFFFLFFMLRCIFLPAVVVGIVVAGTEIRAQACLSAKAAAACKYRAVVGCVDPSDCHQVPLMLIPLLPLPCHHGTAPGQPQCRPLLPSHCCFPVTKRKPLLFFILYAAHSDSDSWAAHLRHGSSVPVRYH